MKKEFITVTFLVLMLAAAIVNIRYLNGLTDRVSALVSEASDFAEKEDWADAVKKGEEASDLWKKSDPYTHLVLRHSEIEATTDSIYGFLSEIYAQDRGTAKGAAMAALSRLDSISSIEQIRLGSIF